MELEHLLFEVRDHLATITLNRPEARWSVPLRYLYRAA